MEKGYITVLGCKDIFFYIDCRAAVGVEITHYDKFVFEDVLLCLLCISLTGAGGKGRETTFLGMGGGVSSLFHL